MSREAQSSPLSTWPEGLLQCLLGWRAHYYPMAGASQSPVIGINGAVGPERGRVALRQPSVRVHGELWVLTFHSPSSGWVSCTGELPWELRVWEGSM